MSRISIPKFPTLQSTKGPDDELVACVVSAFRNKDRLEMFESQHPAAFRHLQAVPGDPRFCRRAFQFAIEMFNAERIADYIGELTCARDAAKLSPVLNALGEHERHALSADISADMDRNVKMALLGVLWKLKDLEGMAANTEPFLSPNTSAAKKRVKRSLAAETRRETDRKRSEAQKGGGKKAAV